MGIPSSVIEDDVLVQSVVAVDVDMVVAFFEVVDVVMTTADDVDVIATDEGIAVDTMVLVIAVLATASLVAVTTNKTKNLIIMIKVIKYTCTSI